MMNFTTVDPLMTASVTLATGVVPGLAPPAFALQFERVTLVLTASRFLSDHTLLSN